MVDFLADFLRSQGLTVELQPVINPTLEYVKFTTNQAFFR